MPSDPAETSAPLRPPARWDVRIVVAAVLLAAAQLGPRAVILGRSGFAKWPTLHNPAHYAGKLLLAGAYDAAWAAALATIFLLLLTIVRRKNRLGLIVYSLFLAAAVASLLAAAGNVQVVETLGRPFNYQWLYYSDFLKSVDAHEAVRQALSWKVVSAVLSACAAFVLIAMALGAWVDRIVQRFRPPHRRLAAACVFAATVTYLLVGNGYLTSRHWPHDKLANPLIAFAKSVVATRTAPSLFTMKTPVGDDDFAPPPAEVRSTLPATRPAIQHVVLYVLESTPAEYVGAFGSKYHATPHLDEWAKCAAVFTNIYAHAPATNKSLFSILCSSYPWISYQAETQEKPKVELPSLTSELKSRGFSSGFFYSGDLSYQGAGEFVRARGFDFVQDYRQRRSTRKLFTNERWPFLNGSDDLSTTESLIAWMQPQRDQKTFAMLWTNMTHYPYFTDGYEASYGPTENLFNHYLNALHYDDAAFGALMDSLAKAKLLDETLVIVVGDHGEAFGRHDQLSHGNKIYEENCHVPLLLINPKLFHGERHETIGGVSDIAPTVADVLGVPPARAWQGRSLFAVERPNRTYFFAPWSDYLFGYREGNTKFIYNATKNEYELYDLASDPTERQNLVYTKHAPTDEHVKRLAGWVQYQNRKFEKVFDGK